MKRLLIFSALWTVTIIGLIASAPAPDLSKQAMIPDDARQLAQKAADQFKADHFDAAAATYQSIIQTHPDSLYAWSNLGVVRFQQGKFPEARDALKHATALNPKDAFSLSNLGVTYYQLNAYPEAIKSLEAAIAVNPKDATSHDFLGLAYEKMGRKADADREIDRAKVLEHVVP